MIVLSGPRFLEGACVSESNHWNAESSAKKQTLDGCEDYCKTFKKATGCQYEGQVCEIFSYPLHVGPSKTKKHCLIFEKNNNEAREKTRQPNTSGRLTKLYKTNLHTFKPFRREWGKALFYFSFRQNHND